MEQNRAQLGNRRATGHFHWSVRGQLNQVGLSTMQSNVFCWASEVQQRRVQRRIWLCKSRRCQIWALCFPGPVLCLSVKLQVCRVMITVYINQYIVLEQDVQYCTSSSGQADCQLTLLQRATRKPTTQRALTRRRLECATPCRLIHRHGQRLMRPTKDRRRTTSAQSQLGRRLPLLGSVVYAYWPQCNALKGRHSWHQFQSPERLSVHVTGR